MLPTPLANPLNSKIMEGGDPEEEEDDYEDEPFEEPVEDKLPQIKPSPDSPLLDEKTKSKLKELG